MPTFISATNLADLTGTSLATTQKWGEFAPIALRLPLVINHPEVVTKSYPHFWDDLRHTGFNIEERP